MTTATICDNCPFPAMHEGTALTGGRWKLCEECFTAPYEGRMLDHVRADRIAAYQTMHGAAPVVRRPGEVHIPVSAKAGYIAWIVMRPEPRNSPYPALYTGYVMRVKDAHTWASLPCQTRESARDEIDNAL